MANARMTTKGQITVPKEVREDLGLTAGSTVMFVKVADGQYRLLARTGSMADLDGLLRRPGQQKVELDEMEEAIAGAAAASRLDAGSPE